MEVDSDDEDEEEEENDGKEEAGAGTGGEEAGDGGGTANLGDPSPGGQDNQPGKVAPPPEENVGAVGEGGEPAESPSPMAHGVQGLGLPTAGGKAGEGGQQPRFGPQRMFMDEVRGGREGRWGGGQGRGRGGEGGVLCRWGILNCCDWSIGKKLRFEYLSYMTGPGAALGWLALIWPWLCFGLPCLAVPCLVFPCLALPCLPSKEFEYLISVFGALETAIRYSVLIACHRGCWC